MSELIVGKWKDRYLLADGQQFVLLAATTGGEKGVAIVLPNLLNFDDSVVVFDLKLENDKLTSLFRQRHG
jgi:type IV secretion system protein VirD4